MRSAMHWAAVVDAPRGAVTLNGWRSPGSSCSDATRCPAGVCCGSQSSAAVCSSATQFAPRCTPRARVIRYILPGRRRRGPWHLESQYVAIGS
jgi:hypothetical protein